MGRTRSTPGQRSIVEGLQEQIRVLEKRVASLELRVATKRTYTSGDDARVEIGVLDGTGTVGIRVYDSSDVLQFEETAT